MIHNIRWYSTLPKFVQARVRSLLLHLLVAALSIVLISTSTLNFHRTSAQDVRLDQTLLHALDSNYKVRVIVMLQPKAILETDSASKMELQQKSAIEQIQATVLNALDAADFETVHRYHQLPALTGMVTSVGLKKLLARPEVSNVMLDLPGDGHLDASGPALGLPAVQGELGMTGAGVTVAILDSGIDTDHPDLADSIVAQHCFTSPTPPLWNQGDCLPDDTNEGESAEDNQGHGTHVSGIVASNGTVSAVGFAPDANLVVVRVLNRKNAGWVSDWVKGIDWILEHFETQPIQILNMSLGTVSRYTEMCDDRVPVMAAAIGRLRAKGVTIFASSGNRGDSTGIASPACNSGVISVGATYDGDLGRQPAFNTYLAGFGVDCFDAATSLQTITCFTNSNANLDLLAPGALIESTGKSGGTAVYRGTSQAAPTAAGVAALMLQAAPGLNPDTIEMILKASGTPIKDTRNGLTFPLINALNAVTMAPLTLTSVTIHGPTEGEIDKRYPFTATLHLQSPTPPFTFTWSATDLENPIVATEQSTTNSTRLEWTTPGEKLITTQVESTLGKASQTHLVMIRGAQIPQAIQQLRLDGSRQGHTGVVHALHATVFPLTAAQPITYVWETSGQPPLVHVADRSDVGTFLWDEVGSWPITVTAINRVGAISHTETILVSTGQIAGLNLDLPTVASAGVPQSYTVQVPADAKVPINYRWEADGHEPVEQVGGLNDSMRYSWIEPGQKTITVTASNDRSIFTMSQQVEIALLPPISMTLLAPRSRLAGQSVLLIASVQPISVSLPITYEWNATDQTGVTHMGSQQDIASFIWSTTGPVTVTIRATNAAGTIIHTYAFDIAEIEASRKVFLPLVTNEEGG